MSHCQHTSQVTLANIILRWYHSNRLKSKLTSMSNILYKLSVYQQTSPFDVSPYQDWRPHCKCYIKDIHEYIMVDMTSNLQSVLMQRAVFCSLSASCEQQQLLASPDARQNGKLQDKPSISLRWSDRLYVLGKDLGVQMSQVRPSFQFRYLYGYRRCCIQRHGSIYIIMRLLRSHYDLGPIGEKLTTP